MNASALLADVQAELARDDRVNRLVPLVAAGTAPLATIGALAAEEHRVVASDWRSCLTLAARCADPAGRAFYTELARGEAVALPLLDPLAAACGVELTGGQPRAGCQAYPSFVAWLALNADPAAAVVAIVANFAAWGDYCGTIATGLRSHYGLDDDACAFFDLFAAPAPELAELAVAAVQAGLDAGRPLDSALEHARLLQSYELMFWNTLADVIV